MKILFINSRKFDYAQDLTFSGLAAVLGRHSIRDLPFNFTYHLNFKPYPKNLGGAGFSATDIYRASEIRPDNCDFVFLGSLKPDALEVYLKVLPEIPKSTPIVLIEGGDHEAIGGDAYRLKCGHLWEEAIRQRPFDFIFKREFLKDTKYADNVRPLPFSMNFSALKVQPSRVFDKDVSFWAVESHPIRTQGLDLLKGQFDCDRNGTSKNQVFKNYKYKGRRYHEELAKCKIVLSLRGGGWDTLRYWEVPALGPLLVSQKLNIEIPNDFEHKKHVIFCQDDLSDLIDICRYYLQHESERLKISTAAYAHLKKYHSHTARANYIVENLIRAFSPGKLGQN